MAVTITTNYVGKEAGSLFVSAVGMAETTIGKGAFTVNDKVKGKGNIGLIKAGVDIWAAEDGLFSNTGTLAKTNKPVSLDYKKVNLTLLKKDFAVDWTAFDMTDGATGTIVGETRAKLEEEIKGRIAMGTDAGIWADILTEADADATVVDVTIAALTSANIIANMQKVFEAYSGLDSGGASDSLIVMSSKTRAILNGAQIGVGQLDMRGDKTQDYGGVQIIDALGVQNDTIYMTRVANLHFQADTLGDFNKFAMIDQSPITGANAIHVVMNAGFKASYADGTQLVVGQV